MGTSTAKEAKEYFADMERHRILFRYAGPEDDAAITLVWSYKSASICYALVSIVSESGMWGIPNRVFWGFWVFWVKEKNTFGRELSFWKQF